MFLPIDQAYAPKTVAQQTFSKGFHGSVRGLFSGLFILSFVFLFFTRWVVEGTFEAALVTIFVFSIPIVLVSALCALMLSTSRFATLLLVLVFGLTSTFMLAFAFQPKVYNETKTKMVREMDERNFKVAMQDAKAYEDRVKAASKASWDSFDKK